MKRSIIVTLVGFLMAWLLIWVGDKVVEDQIVASSGLLESSPNLDLAALTLKYALKVSIAIVHIPTAFLVGVFVGILSNKHQFSSAIIATGPAWIEMIAIGLSSPSWMLVGMLIGGFGVFGAWFASWVLRIRSGVGPTACT
jgi:hypothetical protein